MRDSFLETLSSPASPVPGGGAAAAHAALVGLALLQKIVGVERRRQANQKMISFWEGLAERAADTTRRLHGLRDEDGRSYLRFADARSAGKNKAALAEAVACPAEIMETAGEAMEIVLPAMENCKPHLLSDLLAAADLLSAASRAACRIAQANLRHCDDPVLRVEYQNRLLRIDALRQATLERAADTAQQRSDAR